MKICIVDTETTIDNTVADFGAVVADLATGEILDEIGCLIYDQFDEIELWSNPYADKGDFWSRQHTRTRRKQYVRRIKNGQRSIASENLVNVWLAKNVGRYNPTPTGINVGMFRKEFCLLKKAREHFSECADFVAWCHKRNALTKTGKPSFTADNVARFILGDALDPEPHTALEDARDYELPIAKYLYERDAL
jgi:hypothetical protein